MQCLHVVLALLGLVAVTRSAQAFPGLLVAKDEAERRVTTTHVVLMTHGGVSVVTVMADYEGPRTPFAFVLPVPGDVREQRLETVKRGIVARLEQVSAPRFHAFFEQDPCRPGPVEQQWEERIRARGQGFLTPLGIPPADDPYKVSNEMSVALAPVFKGQESEFRYRLLSPKEPAELGAWLEAEGYRVGDDALGALAPWIGPDRRLLVAEVLTDRVELAGDDRIELGGIRYATRRPATTIAATLGRPRGVEDLFLYVLDRARRYEAKNYDNVSLPTNVVIDASAGERVGRLYNALFDLQRKRTPGAFVTEFVWTTAGCGEPCPDEALEVRELMSLGGDVLESETTRAAERAPPPLLENDAEKQRFAAEVRALPAAERARARRQHIEDSKELARRRALTARQTYVLTRLHFRYDASSPARDERSARRAAAANQDVEIGPVETHLRGGVGIPEGAEGRLSRAAAPAARSELQSRFVALERWRYPAACATPARFRWGKRWISEARAPHRVPLALNLGRTPRDPGPLSDALRAPLPELGLTALPAPPSAAPPADPVRAVPPERPKRPEAWFCALGTACGVELGVVLGAVACWLGLRRAVRRRPDSAGG